MAAFVYLLHAERPYYHAQHYVGFCKRKSGKLEDRIDEHRRGQGSPLVRAWVAVGIGFVVARVWRGKQATRRFERALKKGKNTRRLHCPICREAGRAA